MTESGDALQRAEHARELAEKAAELLGDSRVDAESATAADVESETDVDVRQQPQGEPAKDSDITGPGAPMP